MIALLIAGLVGLAIFWLVLTTGLFLVEHWESDDAR